MIGRVNIQAFVYAKNPELTFLLLKRKEEKGGFWQPVSGGVERNEEAMQAVKRELWEETGLIDIIKIIDLQFSFTFQTTKNNMPITMKDICFGVEVKRAQRIELSNEYEAFVWCSLEEVKQYLEWQCNLAAFDRLLKVL